MCDAIIDETMGTPLEYQHLIKQDKYREVWVTLFANELECLAQGTHDVQGTNTIYFISCSAVPRQCPVTYGHIVVDYHPQKQELNHTSLTVGGNGTNYPCEVATPTADLTMATLLFNSTIATPGAKFFGVDVKNFYLNTPLDHFEYMRLPLDLIPAEIISQCNLHKIEDNGWTWKSRME